MTFYGSSLIFNIDSSHVRLCLRVYFTGLFLLLALVGDQCCSLRVKLRLIKRDSVNIPLMTGWLSGFSAAAVWVKQRRSPAGWLGVVMIVVQLLAYTSDLLVSSLVSTTNIPSRCSFGSGIVVPLQPVTWRSNPDLNQKAERIVSQAQITSKANGGLTGIYAKVNTDPNFRADPQDVLGNWVCNDIHNDTIYPANLTLTPHYVLQDLVNRDLLYPNSSGAAGNIPGGPNQGWNTFVAWGASVGNSVQQPWDVRASVDITVNESDYNPRTFRNFYCTLNASSVEWILSLMDGDLTMEEWVFALQDAIYEGKPSDIGSNIAIMLETITQIGWGGSVSTNDTSPLNPTQGCLSPRATVPLPIFIILLISTVGMSLMLSYWVALLFIIRSVASRLSKRHVEAVEERTPNGLVAWMTQAVRENGACGDVEAKNLGKWKFILKDDGRMTIQ